MPARPAAPTRLLAAALLTATAVLTLTACDDGEGLRDEGPSDAGLSYWDVVPAGTQPSPPRGNS